MFSMTVCSRWAMNSRAFSEQKLRLKPIRQFLRAHVTVRFEDEDRRQHCNWVEQAGFLHLSSGTSFEEVFRRGSLCMGVDCHPLLFGFHFYLSVRMCRLDCVF